MGSLAKTVNQSFRVELPLPISLNNAYANRRRGGRYPTQAHIAWKYQARLALMIAKPQRVDGPYTFQILVPLKMRGDASNRIKLAEDLLVEDGLTPDDHLCVDARATRSEDVPPGRCMVIVEKVR